MIACPSELELERFATGEATAADRARIGDHVESCSTCSERLESSYGDEQLLADLRRAVLDEEPAADGAEAPPPASDALARYRVLGRLGEGGMGIVYEAEQQSPRRRVALKILRPGVAGTRGLRRFEFEAEVLGRLDHPNIARVFEAGTHESGGERQPFFAMELVAGRNLDAYVRETGATVSERLELFLAVCHAVQHAHQKGVIHRDLKPANILVTDDGTPKVLDFGVARAIDADAGTTTVQTIEGQLVGTVSYMSPEQVAGDLELDTRADVYALGVILYELLSGERPIDVSGMSLAKAARAIEEVEPVPLGARDPDLRGDLETIARAALSKDRERRYASVTELAEDVRRTLDHEPIAARPPSAGYVLSKFVRRRPAVAAAIVVLVLGVIGTGTQSWRAARAEGLANEQRDEALRSAAQAEMVKDALKGVMSEWDPAIGARGASSSVRDSLDAAAARIEGQFADEPEVELELRTTLGRAYRGLGAYEEALVHLERSLEIQRGLHGPTHPNVAAALNDVAQALGERGELRDAIELRRQALAMFADCGVEHSASLGNTLSGLGAALIDTGEYDEAREVLRGGLEMRRAIHGQPSREVANSLSQLARLELDRENYELGDPLARGARAMHVEAYGADHPYTIACDVMLAQIELRLGDPEVARRSLEEALERQTERLGERHPTVGQILISLASIHAFRGETEESVELSQRALEIYRELPGESTHLIDGLQQAAESLLRASRFEEAAEAAEEIVELATAVYGAEHEEVGSGYHLLSQAATARGDYDEAERLALEAERIFRERNGDLDPAVARVLQVRGYAYMAAGRYEESLELVNRALGIVEVTLGPESADAYRCIQNRGIVLEKLDRLEEAEADYRLVMDYGLRTKAFPEADERARRLVTLLERQGRRDEALDVLRHRTEFLPEGMDLRVTAFNQLASRLFRYGRYEEAEAAFRELIDIKRAHYGPDHDSAILAWSNLARVLQETGKYEESVDAARTAVDAWTRIHSPDHEMTTVARAHMARSLHLAGRPDEARAEFERALAILRAGDDAGRLSQTEANYRECLEALARDG